MAGYMKGLGGYRNEWEDIETDGRIGESMGRYRKGWRDTGRYEGI